MASATAQFLRRVETRGRRFTHSISHQACVNKRATQMAQNAADQSLIDSANDDETEARRRQMKA